MAQRPLRYEIRTPAGEVLGHMPSFHAATTWAQTRAILRGGEVQVRDTLAPVGEAHLWAIRPSGKVEPLEKRSIESLPVSA